MSSLTITEGEVDFDAPGAGKPCKTWYKIVGNLDSTSPPLILLHGGPGAGHDYLLPLIDIHQKHGIPLIFYDQIGAGHSTRFKERMGDVEFWTFDLFVKELDNLIDHFQLREKGFYLLGQSWGGILACDYASRRPKGLLKVINHSGPASIPLYVEGCKGILAGLPPDVSKTLEDCDRRGDYESEEFEKAQAVFYAHHMCRLDPVPDEVQASFKNIKEDPTAYWTMQGPSEFIITGSLKEWEGWQDAQKIEVETLVISGRYDEVTEISMEPWSKHIPKVKWVIMENSSHLAHFEERERFMRVVGEFLTD
ncbi:L-amino acid amidase [Cladorrhinum sp. PSN259]|nr:L-amino acid amidase [Cladorrhinum sp. PSN259]